MFTAVPTARERMSVPERVAEADPTEATDPQDPPDPHLNREQDTDGALTKLMGYVQIRVPRNNDPYALLRDWSVTEILIQHIIRPS